MAASVTAQGNRGITEAVFTSKPKQPVFVSSRAAIATLIGTFSLLSRNGCRLENGQLHFGHHSDMIRRPKCFSSSEPNERR